LGWDAIQPGWRLQHPGHSLRRQRCRLLRRRPRLQQWNASNPLEAQVIAVYENVSPAVVNITNRGYVYDFFMQAVPQEGSGSGFVYDQEGHIVTNYHVIENAEELSVTLANGKVYDAKVIGVDPPMTWR